MQNSILQAKRGLDKLQDKLTSVSKMAQQEEGRQLAESIELAGPLDKRIEEILKVKDEAPSLTSYPSSESLQEFESDEIDFGQYWYYAIKAEQIKIKWIRQQKPSMKEMNTTGIQSSMTAFMLNIQSMLKGYISNSRQLMRS